MQSLESFVVHSSQSNKENILFLDKVHGANHLIVSLNDCLKLAVFEIME